MSQDYYERAGLPARHKSFRPADSTDQEWNSMYDSTKKMIENGSIISIIGPRGSGKTQLGACLIGHTCLNLGRSAIYEKAFGFFLRIREAQKTNGDSERAAVSDFVKPYLFVIDAYEVRGETPFEDRVLNHVIDKRYDNGFSTVIISNHTQSDFVSCVGPSIVDRIRETGAICELKLKSFRSRR